MRGDTHLVTDSVKTQVKLRETPVGAQGLGDLSGTIYVNKIPEEVQVGDALVVAQHVGEGSSSRHTNAVAAQVKILQSGVVLESRREVFGTFLAKVVPLEVQPL